MLRYPRTLAAAATVLLVSAPPLAAQQQDQPADEDVQLTRAAVATGVEEREPTGEAVSFPADVGVVFFHTVFEGDFPQARFEHVWLRDGEEVARVALEARGPRWRTWSSKRIPPDWAGSWTVRVVDSQGNELQSVEFSVGR